MPDRAPYQDEREAHAAAVAAVPPAPGRLILSPAQRIELLRLALDGAGVETSPYEDRQAAWLTEWSDHLIAIIARWVQTAHEAGKASAMEGAVAEWGIRWEAPEGSPLATDGRKGAQPVGDEETARVMARIMPPLPGWSGTLVSREVGPWKEVDDA